MFDRAKLFLLLVAGVIGLISIPLVSLAQSSASDRPKINPVVSDVITSLGLKLQGWTDSRIGRIRFAPEARSLNDDSGYDYAASKRTGAAILDLKQLSSDPLAFRIVVNYRFDDNLGRRAFSIVSAVFAVSGDIVYISSAIATADTPDVGRLVVMLAPGDDGHTAADLIQRPFLDIIAAATANALTPEQLAALPDQNIPMRLYVFDMLRASHESSMGVAFSGTDVRSLAEVTASEAANKDGFRVAIVDGNYNLGARPGFIFDVVSDSGKGQQGTVRLLRKFSSTALK